MNLLTLLSPLLTFFFGCLVIYISYANDKARRIEAAREEVLRKRLMEAMVMREMQEKISYSLSIEKTIDIIIESLHALFPNSNISSVSMKKGKLVYQMHVRESVGNVFVNYVKTNLLASFPESKHQRMPDVIDEFVFEEHLNGNDTRLPGSFFRVPFIVNKVVVGVIGISSVLPQQYFEEDLRLLDQLVGQAGISFSQLQHVLEKDEEIPIAIIESLSDGIFMVDEQHTLTMINNKARRLLGIVKDAPTTLDAIAALSSSIDLSACLREVLLYEKRCESKDTMLNKLPVMISVVPVYQRHRHSVTGALVILREVSAEKEKTQIKEDFTNIMIHELRSPLTAIKGASQFLKANSSMDKENRERLLGIINEQSRKLLEQITIVLDAARLDAGRFTIDKSVGDIRSLINETVQVFEAEAKTKNIVIKTEFGEELPMLPFDPLRIGQVLNDLLSNSLKYTQPGGTVAIKAIQQDGYVVVSVSDNGIGIPKDKQAELFSKFARINQEGKPITNRIIGTGLGLYIARGIIDGHGGKISLQSDEHKGTTICFTLPIENVKAAFDEGSLLTASSVKPGILLPLNDQPQQNVVN